MPRRFRPGATPKSISLPVFAVAECGRFTTSASIASGPSPSASFLIPSCFRSLIKGCNPNITPGKDSRQIVTLANVGLLELSRCEAQTIRVILEILIAGALLTDQIYLYDAMSYSLCCKRV